MPAVCDTKARYASDGPFPISSCPSPALTERDLAHLWEGQRFPPAALATAGGEPLRVVYRGLAVGGPGPDFRDAVIAAPWGLLHGDVELHVRASDFARHGHGRDPAYDRLALHLVFWDDEGEDTPLASGRRVPVAALAPWAERRSQEILRWLRRPALWQEPCRSALNRLGPEAVAAALDNLGDQRFCEKVEAMRRHLERAPADEALWQGLLEALGYGGGRQAFRSLAMQVPWRKLAGKLNQLPPSQRLAEARRLLVAAAGPLASRRAGQGRPGNEGWRRLEGAARLAVRFCQAGLAASLEALLGRAEEGGPAPLLAALSVGDGREASPAEGEAGRQALRQGSGQALRQGSGQALRQGSGQAFIGRSRALEIAVNVVLPYAAACGDAGMARRAEALYARLPRPSAYGAVRHLDRALRPFDLAQGRLRSGQALRQGSGQAVGGGVRVDARRQQGMLYLLRNYCTQGGCGRCPLS